jgi:RNA recognition motif-containing protein
LTGAIGYSEIANDALNPVPHLAGLPDLQIRCGELHTDDLEALFSQVGKVVSAAVVSDKFSGQSRGFGFVEMESSADAAKAISEFDGKDLKGRNLKVNEAKPRAKPREFGGGGGGRDS